MSQMHSSEDDYEHVQDEPEDEDARSLARNEQSTRTFFALLSFFIAVILLGAFLSTPLDGLSKMLVLFGGVAFGILGVLLFEKRLLSSNVPASQRRLDSTDEPVEVQDISDLEEAEQEEDEEPSAFEQLVQEALDSIPEEFHKQMENLVVIVEDEPNEETLEHVGSEEGHILLGLYQGVPLTALGYQRSLVPERITIYQRTIEHYCHGDPERIRAQVRATVLHEVAHHFGLGHEEMPIWIK
ncbi:MAG TPA: metallopeptidase family protein [Ktedonobacteraceae bacterium]|nr:metallopeptidase family protein [Ktedonobacteraceae bacterium]